MSRENCPVDNHETTRQFETYKEVERYTMSTKHRSWRLSATIQRMVSTNSEAAFVRIKLSHTGRQLTHLALVHKTAFYYGLELEPSSIGLMISSPEQFNDWSNKEQIVLSCINNELVRQSDKNNLYIYRGPQLCVKAVDKPCASLQEFLERLGEPKQTTAEVIAEWILESC